MSIIKKGGHGVTSVLPSTSDAAAVSASPPTFRNNTGSAGYNGVGKGGGNFKMTSRSSKKKGTAPNKSVSKLITK